MLVGYARASLEKQTIDRQFDELMAAGVDRRNIYHEKVTGTKRDRQELNRMLSELRAGDTVLTVELTRFSRSTKDLLDIVDKIRERGANFKSLKEAWMDTSTPQGQLTLTIFAGLSQFERDLTSERTLSGLKAAKARGRCGGRPSMQREKAELVEALYRGGMKISEIVSAAACSRSTVNRIIAGIKAQNAG